jgi:GDP-4-dehydro-6-deoxy-D-mannose reductase
MNKEIPVLITGSEGFVGTKLKIELKNSGYLTLGTSLKEVKTGQEDNIFQCDITNPEEINKLVYDKRPAAIFHLAALVKPSDAIKDPVVAFKLNLGGTRNILDAVRAIPEYRPKIIIIGSSEMFGVTKEGVTVTEETPFAPVNPYGESKLEAWKLAEEYIQKYNLDIVCAIPFNHTGPGQAPGFIAPDVAAQIVEIERGLRDPILVTGNIAHKRNFSDVRDVARAYRLLLELGRTGERYIICADQSIPLSFLVNTLIEQSLVKIEHRIDPNKARPADIADISASHDKITRETGWRPEIPLEKTLKDLLDYYRLKQ